MIVPMNATNGIREIMFAQVPTNSIVKCHSGIASQFSQVRDSVTYTLFTKTTTNQLTVSRQKWCKISAQFEEYELEMAKTMLKT